MLARELVTLLSRANRRLGSSYLAADICSIRRLTDWHRRLHWHTDYHGGGTAHYDPCFNIWLPLTAVGREQPSVELVRGSHRRMRELPPSETGIYLLLKRAALSRPSVEWSDDDFDVLADGVVSSIKRDFLDMEWYWLSLARSYEFAEQSVELHRAIQRTKAEKRLVRSPVAHWKRAKRRKKRGF